MRTLKILRPDDWHLHLRDGDVLADLVPHSARTFGRVLVMPNLKPPVTTVAMALAYRDRIRACAPAEAEFEPYMALYLTSNTSTFDVEEVRRTKDVIGFKLYPLGATTNAQSGVGDLHEIAPVLRAMEGSGVPLLIHGESIDPSVDVFDRESVFVRDQLRWVVDTFPSLRVVLEHVSSAAAVDFVKAAPDHVVATITAHHLLYDRNAMFEGGIRPHYYCLPVLKRSEDRRALLEAATSGSPKFFLGTDSAPHRRDSKETSCGCAGIFTAHVAIELYAEAFASVDALDALEGFASRFGAAFYGLAAPRGTLMLEEQPQEVPQSYPMGSGKLVPLRAGERVRWRVVEG